MNVCCVFSLELPHLGDSNEYTQYSIFNIKKEKSPEIILNLQLWDFFQGTQESVPNSRGNEPSVFQPLKVYCISASAAMERELYVVNYVNFIKSKNSF